MVRHGDSNHAAPATPDSVVLAHCVLDGCGHRVDGPAGELHYRVCPAQDGEQRRQELVPPLAFGLHHDAHRREVVGEPGLRGALGVLFSEAPDPVRVRHLVEHGRLPLHMCAHHLEVVLWSLVKPVNDEVLAVEGSDVSDHLRRDVGPLGELLGVLLAEGQVVDPVRDVCERRIDVHVSECLRLQEKMSGHPGHPKRALHLATLIEHGVVLRHYQVAVPDARCQKRDDVVHGPLVLENLEGPVALVESQRREGGDAGLLAFVTEVNAVHFQHLDGGLMAVAVGKLHLVADLAGRIIPHNGEFSAMDAPLREEVHQGEVVEGHRGLEVAVLEVVRRRRPIRVQRLFLSLAHIRLDIHLLQH
mmetsp:Transcript_84860/g.216140  ORF Transcript_84860/g.216140 Transcript_84860/m.216140 type:complete len:360 (+) Transcript_84860:19-1098(+)